MIESKPKLADLGTLLDFGPWTLYQKIVVVLTASAVICDGMDIQIVGFAIPAIAKEWGLGRSHFASVIAAGLLGVTIGSAIGGLAGDRVGRRPALIVSVLFFGISTCAMALTHSLLPLLLLRFCAGLGIGGALPNAATLAAEYTPLRVRPFATTLTITCIPAGGAVAGILASSLLSEHSWRLLFLVAGLLPMALVFILLVFLPESPRFLAKDERNRPKVEKILNSTGRSAEYSTSSVASEGPREVQLIRGPRALFVGSQARDTALIWGAFFSCLLTVYLAFNWLPSILLECHLTAKEASEGLTLYNCGGIAGALGMGWWISRQGSRMPMLLGSGAGVLSALLVASLLQTSPSQHSTILAVIGIHGLAVNAVQTTLYALATHFYATHIRATGVAFALAVGRTGAITSAYLGAGLLGLGGTIYFLVLATTMLLVLIFIGGIANHVKSPKTSG